MIGIFDSGVGGLTVASAIRKQSPSADFVYFGDLANMPFGEKSEAELLEITKSAMKFLIEHGATEIVAACNSVSMYVPALRSEVNVPLIEMSAPTVNALIDRTSISIFVVATAATVRSQLYDRAFAEKGIEINSMAIPELASAIEADLSNEEIKKIITSAVDRAIELNAKTLVLGCTQYPFARSSFEECFRLRGYQIELFDPADAVASAVVSQFDTNGKGKQTFFVSKPSPVFDTYVDRLFPGSITNSMS